MNFVFELNFRKVKNNEIVYERGFFHNGPFIIKSENDLVLDKFIEHLAEKISSFSRNGSGWIFEKVQHITIHVTMYTPVLPKGNFKLVKVD